MHGRVKDGGDLVEPRGIKLGDYVRLPAHQRHGDGRWRIRRRVAAGPFQAHVAGSCAAKRCEVASGDDEKAIVANGGAPNGRFSALLGDADGH